MFEACRHPTRPSKDTDDQNLAVATCLRPYATHMVRKIIPEFAATCIIAYHSCGWRSSGPLQTSSAKNINHRPQHSHNFGLKYLQGLQNPQNLPKISPKLPTTPILDETPKTPQKTSKHVARTSHTQRVWARAGATASAAGSRSRPWSEARSPASGPICPS